MFDKKQKIYTTKTEGSIKDAVLDIFSQVDRTASVLKLTFFHLPADNAQYLINVALIKQLAKEYFGCNTPLISYIAQKPHEATITAEAIYIDEDSTIERRNSYVIIKCGLNRTIVTEGIIPDNLDTSIYNQSCNIFDKISDILKESNMATRDIYRQWNYIQNITEEHEGKQNYQEFNDARSLFYYKNEWHSNYPAATGIGTTYGGVMIEICATTGGNVTNCPIDNPLQTSAHAYSQKVLIGINKERERKKTTPKFERARIVGEAIYISGTAAIHGEDSLSSQDISAQTASTMLIMDTLISPKNLPIPCHHTEYSTLRVYVKNISDIKFAKEYLQQHYPIPQKHYVVADICRPELLIEIEGTANIVFIKDSQ